MGLSEREKQVLAEMERDLFGASTIDPSLPAANSLPKIVAGLALAVVGLSVVLFGAISGLVWFGLVGFAVTLFGILMASANKASGAHNGSKTRKTSSQTKPKRDTGSYFEDRWDKRDDR
ncbi:MAG: hypothetical protein RLZZ164_704 [Actinomycetota bacterium]|jgi:hypothetical protein